MSFHIFKLNIELPQTIRQYAMSRVVLKKKHRASALTNLILDRLDEVITDELNKYASTSPKSTETIWTEYNDLLEQIHFNICPSLSNEVNNKIIIPMINEIRSYLEQI